MTSHNHSHNDSHGKHKHSHSHSHSHSLSHEKISEQSWKSVKKALVWGIVLNLIYLTTEFAFGFKLNSMALISDAGHNLGDVLGLVISLLAFRLARVLPSKKYTYGYKKGTIVASFLNALILLVAVGIILWESIDKLMNPHPVEGEVVAWVAGIGIFINGLTAFMILRTRRTKDLNVKSAYLHMVADTLVSIGVVISGIAIQFTGWVIIDPIVGIAIAVVILLSTSKLLFQSLQLSLDGVPIGVEKGGLEEKIIEKVKGVKAVHHLHLWAISTSENALTGHIVVDSFDHIPEIKVAIKKTLLEEGVSHSTLEFEISDEQCLDTNEFGELEQEF